LSVYEHDVGDLVTVDSWVGEMISDALPLTDVPAPSYAAAPTGMLRLRHVAVVLRVVSLETQDDALESYSYVLSPEGVGWVNSSYLERIPV